MYTIGDFSTLSKTTIKTLRYYEKEKLLIPRHIDKITGYRYYDTSQLIELNKIISLRQIGISIKDIKRYLEENNIKDVLNRRKNEVIEELKIYDTQLSKINYLLEENIMKNEIILKELPECIVYYKDGMVEDYSKLANFILISGEECLELNPNIKCISPDYCFISYLDGEYKEKDIKVRYAQAVENFGIESETIKFKKLDSVTAVSLLHKGSYNSLGETYSAIMEFIEKNNYEIIDYPRECYIDGVWNKDNEDDYLTEIEVPVKKK